MTLLALIIYTRVHVVRPFNCTNCVRVYTIERAYARAYICARTCIRMSLRLFTRENANAVSYVRTRAFACVRLRACLRADLIKTQNTFAHKIFQHSNALWVQKLSGCTIYKIPSSNFLNQLNLLLLKQFFGRFYEIKFPHCETLKSQRLHGNFTVPSTEITMYVLVVYV